MIRMNMYFERRCLEMVSLKDYIENHLIKSIVDLLTYVDNDKVFVRSHYRSFPKRK